MRETKKVNTAPALLLVIGIFLATAFPVMATQPVVITDSALNVQATSALLKGHVNQINSDPAGPGIIEYGFVWDTISRDKPGNIAPGQSGYSGKWSTSPPNSIINLSYSAPAGTFAAGTTIYYRACAKNGDNEWGYGGELSFLTPPAPAVRVSPINGDYVHGNSVTFQWNASPGATHYSLRIRKGDTVPFYKQDVGNALSKTVTGFLNDGQEYTWIVTAQNASPNAQETTPWKFFNGPYPPPSVGTIFPPTNIQATTATISGQLTWNQGPLIKRRGFVWDTVSHGDPGNIPAAQAPYSHKWTQTGDYGSGTYSHEIDIPPATVIYYRACARNHVEIWAYGQEHNFISCPPAPMPICPVPTQACAMNHTTVRFQWEAAQSAASYSIFVRKLGAHTPFHQQEIGNQTILDVTGKFPDDGTQFEWRVRAGNQSGWGEWSAWKTFTNGTLTAPTETPTLLSPANAARIPALPVSFTWKPIAGATKYRIQISDQPAFSRSIFSRETTTPSCTTPVKNIQIQNETGEKTRYWRVSAGNAAGWGPWSKAWRFVFGSN